MREIRRLEIYKLNGTEYRSLKDIQDHVHNKIGSIIDSMDVTLTPKQKLNILQGIIDNKDMLRSQLDVCIDFSDNIQGDFRNILDVEV